MSDAKRIADLEATVVNLRRELVKAVKNYRVEVEYYDSGSVVFDVPKLKAEALRDAAAGWVYEGKKQFSGTFIAQNLRDEADQVEKGAYE